MKVPCAVEGCRESAESNEVPCDERYGFMEFRLCDRHMEMWVEGQLNLLKTQSKLEAFP